MKIEGISRGIFWVLADTEDELSPDRILMFAKGCDMDGIPVDFIGLNSSDGMSYNHKATWIALPKKTTHGKPFDYYPRGRVEIRNGKATIWLNANILHLADEIKHLFGLNGIPVSVREDGSEHYKCHFDRS